MPPPTKLPFLTGFTIDVDKIPKYTAFSKPFTVVYDKKLLKKLLKQPDDILSPESKTEVTNKVYKNLADNKLKISYSQRRKLGRFYPDSNIALVPHSKKIKHTVFKLMKWEDVDMCKGHATIAAELGFLNTIELSEINNYITNYDAIITELTEYYTLDEKNPPQKDQMKWCFNMMIYGGGFDSWVNEIQKGEEKKGYTPIQLKNIDKKDEFGNIIPHPIIARYKNDCNIIKNKIYDNNRELLKHLVNEGEVLSEHDKKNRLSSFFFQIIENHILYLVYKFLVKKKIIDEGRCELEYDGLCIPPFSLEIKRDDLIKEINDMVYQKTGLRIKFIFKGYDNDYGLNDFIRNYHSEDDDFEEDDDDDDTKLKLGVDGVNDDAGACNVILEIYPYWKTCKKTLYVFDNTTGMWSDDISIYYSKFLDCEDRLWILKTNKDGDYYKTDRNYARNESLRRNVISFIKTKTIDNDWLREKEQSSMGKLLFPNGVLDLKEQKFYHKDKYPFNPEIVFSYRMPQDFVKDELDIDYINSIKQRLFYNPLGEEVGEFLILQFARALAGDLAKQITFGIGFGNNGKSVLSDAIKNSCGDYFGSFDAEDFTYNPNSSRDGGQKMRPFFLARNKRILISNELGGGCIVNGDMVKKNSSGGDVLKGRLHSGNETEFTPQYMVFFFSNEFPKFHKIDEATYNRIRVIDFKKKFVDTPVDDDELQKDENISKEIEEIKFRTHFIAMLCSVYFDFVENGKKETIPDEVIRARNDWVGDSGEFNIMGKFVESYEITNNIEDYISSSYIKTWLNIHFKGTSMEKFTKQLKAYCCKKFGENCLVDNKDRKINGRTVRVWHGIKEIDCEDSDDEKTECNN